MALSRCLTCTTLYAVGLFRCPRCHGTEFVEEGSVVPKITSAGGASNAGDQTVEEVESWPGSSSSASTPTPEPKRSRKQLSPRKPAPTTESPSEADQTESSTAPSTAGDPTAPTSEIASDAAE